MTYSDETRDEIRGRLTYWKLMLRGTLSVSKTLLTNIGDVKRFRQTNASEEHYVRPPRRYDLPSYSPSMKQCGSNDRYLRPTRYCNRRAPEVIAMAHALGAYVKSDYDFAQAAFEFVKEKLTLEIRPFVPVEESLRLGTGTCFELITVFIALCRAAGIRARYKIFATSMIDAWRGAVIDVDPLVQKWYNSLGYFPAEGEGEAFIDGQWVVAHVGPTAERQAAAGIPITSFGEDSLGVWFTARPGTIMHLESIPASLNAGIKLLHKIAPGSMERVNVSIQRQIERGGQIIQEAGGLQAYDQQARSKAPRNQP